MVQAKHSKKGPATEDRSQGMDKSCYTFTPKEGVSHQRCRVLQVWEGGALQGSFQVKEGEVGGAKDMKRKQRPAKKP